MADADNEVQSVRLAELTRASETLPERLARLRSGEGATDPKRLASWARAFANGDLDALKRRLSWDGWTIAQASLALAEDTAVSLPEPALWTAEAAAYMKILAGAATNDALPQKGVLPFTEAWVRVGCDGLLPEAIEALGQGFESLKQELVAEVLGLSRSAREEESERFYKDFPVLIRQTTEAVQQWRVRVNELGRRLRTDREDIKAFFSTERDLCRLKSVQGGFSDRHHGGRQVYILHFESGSRLVYKPRSIDLEYGVERWLHWCSEAGLEVGRGPRALPRDGYGWVEYVGQEALPDLESVCRYYRRAGALVAVADLLRANDLHAENVVATADGPVVVDAEMFCQPPRRSLATGIVEGDVLRRGSCLASGLLTQPLTDSQGQRRDLGGLRLQVNGSSNVPFYDGKPMVPESFRAEIAQGYERAYRFFMAHRDELPLHLLEATEVRVLLRPSQSYGPLLGLSVLARHQRSGVRASLLREALWRDLSVSRERPVMWPLVIDERRSLEARDVPRFTVAVHSEILDSSDGEAVEGVLAASGMEGVRQRIAGLNESDLANQLGLIELALSPLDELQCLAKQEKPYDYQALAIDLGEELLRRDLPKHGSLGHGCGGVALFFAALARETGEDRFAAAARQALGSPSVAFGSSGGFTGLGSWIYSVSLVGYFLEDMKLPTRLADVSLEAPSAATFQTAASRNVVDNEDVVDGAAGMLLGLLALWRVTRDAEALRTTQALGQRMSLSPRLAGFAHGASGMARALMALATSTGDESSRQAAVQLWRWEDTHYDSERRNWPILLRDGGKAQRAWSNAWCHGAPGIALSRLLAGGPRIEEALETTASTELGTLDHLCCGVLGRASVLLTAALQRNDETYFQKARALTDEVLERATINRRFQLSTDPKVGDRTHASGFLKGLAGIGYHLLRLGAAAEGRYLPEVLALEAPGELNVGQTGGSRDED